jgi:hypothetical protein
VALLAFGIEKPAPTPPRSPHRMQMPWFMQVRLTHIYM